MPSAVLDTAIAPDCLYTGRRIYSLPCSSEGLSEFTPLVHASYLTPVHSPARPQPGYPPTEAQEICLKCFTAFAPFLRNTSPFSVKLLAASAHRRVPFQEETHAALSALSQGLLVSSTMHQLH